MSDTVLFRCGDCGGNVIITSRTGRTGTYFAEGNMLQLPIPDDFEIATCSTCNEEYFDEATGVAYDIAMAEAYKASIKKLPCGWRDAALMALLPLGVPTWVGVIVLRKLGVKLDVTNLHPLMVVAIGLVLMLLPVAAVGYFTLSWLAFAGVILAEAALLLLYLTRY